MCAQRYGILKPLKDYFPFSNQEQKQTDKNGVAELIYSQDISPNFVRSTMKFIVVREPSPAGEILEWAERRLYEQLEASGNVKSDKWSQIFNMTMHRLAGPFPNWVEVDV